MSLENASGEFYYFVQQNNQGSVHNLSFDPFSSEDQYILNVNVDLTAPPDLLWNNFGFYFDNDYPQILITKLDETQKVLSICAVYDFSGSSDDFENTKDYWMDRQLVNNTDFREFLQDIDPYLRSSSSCHATALSFVRMHNSNNDELIYEESELKLLSQQSFGDSYRAIYKVYRDDKRYIIEIERVSKHNYKRR